MPNAKLQESEIGNLRNVRTGTGRLFRARYVPWVVGFGIIIVLFILAVIDVDRLSSDHLGAALGIILYWAVVAGVPVVVVASVLAHRGIILTIVRYMVILGFGFLSAVVGGILAFGIFECGISLGMLGSNECPSQGGAAWNAAAILGTTLLVWVALSALEHWVIRFTQRWLLPKLPTRLQPIIKQINNRRIADNLLY